MTSKRRFVVLVTDHVEYYLGVRFVTTPPATTVSRAALGGSDLAQAIAFSVNAFTLSGCVAATSWDSPG